MLTTLKGRVAEYLKVCLALQGLRLNFKCFSIIQLFNGKEGGGDFIVYTFRTHFLSKLNFETHLYTYIKNFCPESRPDLSKPLQKYIR